MLNERITYLHSAVFLAKTFAPDFYYKVEMESIDSFVVLV